MLLPGAALVINTAIVIVFLLLCALLACISAAISYKIGPFLSHKTETYKTMVSGAPFRDKWWLHDNRWFNFGWWVGFAIWIYCLVGPVKALVRYIGGL